ncbi:hypothetical protein [Chitinophaga barathri]|uniref:Uncharacterized protein n=1 Tax=Chitinophaga barathri TaxID=1647451 RepID=A0A3N4MH80_9BACT|nr:hypothetical protein [Chitinophaga barathri]RPD42938.1 hypothetical protein EG028_01185 [Chitinophaga barathri]
MKSILFSLCLLSSAVCFAQKKEEIILNRSNFTYDDDPYVSETSSLFLSEMRAGELRASAEYYKSISKVSLNRLKQVAGKAKTCLPKSFWPKDRNKGVTGMYAEGTHFEEPGLWNEELFLSADERGNAVYHMQIKVRFGTTPASGKRKIEEVVVLCGNDIKPIPKEELAAMIKKEKAKQVGVPPPPPPLPSTGR